MFTFHENTELDVRNMKMERAVHSFYMVFWTFFLGGVLGFLIETVWCYFDFGEFSSRTSNLFFPFSIVWAIGAVLLLVFFHFNGSKSTTVLFLKGCIFCGLFEFICGYSGERMLSVTFWDYTELPLHIGRYVNLFICLLWGALCLVWKKWLYSLWNGRVEQFLKKKMGRMITVCMIYFMVISNCISGMALLRMDARRKEVEANNKAERLLDTYFTDEVLQMYFPKMKYLNGEKVYSLSMMAEKGN